MKKENFPNLANEIDIKFQGVQRIPNKMDANRPTPRHIIIKIHTYQLESKKQSKQTRMETESWIWRGFRWLPDGGGEWGNR